MGVYVPVCAEAVPTASSLTVRSPRHRPSTPAARVVCVVVGWPLPQPSHILTVLSLAGAFVYRASVSSVLPGSTSPLLASLWCMCAHRDCPYSCLQYHHSPRHRSCPTVPRRRVPELAPTQSLPACRRRRRASRHREGPSLAAALPRCACLFAFLDSRRLLRLPTAGCSCCLSSLLLYA